MRWRGARVSASPAVRHRLQRVHLTPVRQRTIAVPPSRRTHDVTGRTAARGRAVRTRRTALATTTTIRFVHCHVNLTSVRQIAVAVRPPRATGDSARGIRTRRRPILRRTSLTAGRTVRRRRRQVRLAAIARVPVAITHRSRTRQLADGIDALLLPRAYLRTLSAVVVVARDVRLASVGCVAVAVVPPRIAHQPARSPDATGRCVVSPRTRRPACTTVRRIRRRFRFTPIAHVVVAILPAGITCNGTARSHAARRAVVPDTRVSARAAVLQGRRRVRLTPRSWILIAIPSPSTAGQLTEVVRALLFATARLATNPAVLAGVQRRFATVRRVIVAVVIPRWAWATIALNVFPALGRCVAISPSIIDVNRRVSVDPSVTRVGRLSASTTASPSIPRTTIRDRGILEIVAATRGKQGTHPSGSASNMFHGDLFHGDCELNPSKKAHFATCATGASSILETRQHITTPCQASQREAWSSWNSPATQAVGSKGDSARRREELPILT